MRMILATNNAHKLREFREILSPCGVEIVSLSEMGVTSDPEETGVTFAENAYIKAKAVADKTGMAAIADDSGLAVDALGGAPGIHSARYTGRHDDTDADRRNLLFRNMQGMTERSARFVSAISCVFANGETLEAEGYCEGQISQEERGEGGFGYDSMFIPVGESRTMAEMSADEKNEISHRGKSLRIIAEKMRERDVNK